MAARKSILLIGVLCLCSSITTNAITSSYYQGQQDNLNVTINKSKNDTRVRTICEVELYINGNTDSFTKLQSDEIESASETATKGVRSSAVRDIFNNFLNTRNKNALAGLRGSCQVKLMKDGTISYLRINFPSDIDLSAEQVTKMYRALNDAKLFNSWKEDVNELTITIPLIYYPHNERQTIEQRDTIGNLSLSITNNKEGNWQPYYVISKYEAYELKQTLSRERQDLRNWVGTTLKAKVNDKEIRDIFVSFMSPEDLATLRGGKGLASFTITKSGEIIFLSLRLKYPQGIESIVNFTFDELLRLYTSFTDAKLFDTWTEDVDSATCRFEFEFES